MSLPPVVSSASSSMPKGDARILQEQLHDLLSRMADTTNIIKNWEESEGDDSTVHVETTTQLMTSIRQILEALQRVEGVVKTDEVLQQELRECPIPLDLLDLMDHGGGLNPDCFLRGLLKEALGQLAGLKRRKLALEMLGEAIQQGLTKLDSQQATSSSDTKKESRKEEKEVVREGLIKDHSQEAGAVSINSKKRPREEEVDT